MDIMIDLETLGLDHNAPVIQIGACTFDEACEGFERSIDFESACIGKPLNPSTVKWWLKQEKEAQISVVNGTCEMKQALVDLNEWLKFKCPDSRQVRVWGNGVAFDIEKLKTCMAFYNIVPHWKYWNELDVRTVCHMASFFGLDKNTFPFEGVKHSALADAKHQAKYVKAMMDTLGCES